MILLTAFVCVLVSQSVLAEVNYQHVKTPNGGAYGGTFSSKGVNGGFGGGYSSNGYGGGYGGSFGSSSDGSYGYGGSFDGDGLNSRGGFDSAGTGSFDFINPGQFERLIAGQLDHLQRNFASGISMIHATPGANAYASTSLTNNDNLYQSHIKQQEQLFNSIRKQSQSHAANAGSNYAYAGGSYGPSGVHQTAAVYPENPDSPNVDTRFAAEGPTNGKPHFYGVSSSAVFGSSNVNGVEKTHKAAVTTVNDNGKITTYKSGY